MSDYDKENDLPPSYVDAGYTGTQSQSEQKFQGSLPQPSVPDTVLATETLIYQQPQPSIVYVGLPIRLGDNPAQIMCPNCRASVLTRVKYQSGVLTWLIAGGLCFIGLWLGCCLVPFCVDSCKDAEHYCPNCRYMIGRNKKL
ncbi:lipopolysaccharide-induced tumor necrosis factor-alpha factor [Brachionus plicatilis]|uniref:Lipopolysaccharide-induced tumor necrosis factor-alpha factor n=1 Tax=Brachionus plicatilis TaxID=10195 RepID=A0A3M7SJL6_BRAPC|nr:lipopolysaccharide-induced tumor necrosis factor-alpha factor [Brachionus plicatilis]